MNTQQLKHARRAWSILARRAARGLPPLTYRDLCAMLGIHYRNARHFLGIIQAHVVAHGLPYLNALAVNGDTGLPGPGYVGARRFKGYIREIARVYGTKWSTTAPF